MFLTALPRVAQLAFLAFLPFSILWKGGKTLETTWLLVAVAWFCALTTWARRDRLPEETALRTPLTLWVPLVLFLLWSFISYLTSSTGNYGLDEILRDSSLVLLFFWLLRESSYEAYGLPLPIRILQVLTVSTVIAAILGTAVYIFQPVPRFVGSFFDPRFHTDYWPNAWAELVLMVWPIVWLRPWCHPEPVEGSTPHSIPRGVLRSLATGLLLATLFLSYSRAAYIAFGLQLVLFGIFSWRSARTSLREYGKALLPHTLVLLSITTGFVLCFNALRAGFSPVQSAVEKITFTAAEGTSSITERQQFWKEAWQLLWEKPLFGHGPYSFRFVQTRLQEMVFATSDHPHNIFLKYAAERGLPAAILFGVLLFTILLSTFRLLIINQPRVILSSSKDDIVYSPSRGSWFDGPACPAGRLTMTQYLKPLRIIPVIAVSLVGVLFHLLLDFNMQFVGVALPFWILFALLARENTPSPQSPVPSPHHGLLRFSEISLATMLMLLALFEGRFLFLSSLGRHAETRGDLQEALTWYERARGESFSRDLHLSRAHLFLQTKKPQDALHALDDYLQVNRHDARAWKLLGDAHQKIGDLAAARTAYEEALRLGKWNHLGALRGLLQVLLTQKEKDTIVARREEFDTLLTAYLNAIEHNAHFIALTPNVEEFLAITTILADLFPEDAPQYQALGAKADREAQEERSRIAARPLGRLW